MRVLTCAAVCGLLLAACGEAEPETLPEATSPPIVTTTVPPTTTTVVPVPTTVPVTTTRPRPTTTTVPEPEPEPEVAGTAVVSDDAITAGLIRIAQCEQPGNGAHGVRWDHPGPTYQGGLGLWYGTWDTFKPAGAPDNAGDATIEQQLQAGRNIHARYGFRAWGCAKAVGLS